MRFNTLAKGSLAALLTLVGCGNDNSVSSNQSTPYQYAETREELTEFVRLHYNSRERFPGVDSVRVNNGDVSVYGGFLDGRNERVDTTEVKTDSTVKSTVTREVPRVNQLVIDIGPFDGYTNPSLRLEVDPRFERGDRIPMDGRFLGAILDTFYGMHTERDDDPHSWILWDRYSGIDLWQEVSRRLN